MNRTPTEPMMLPGVAVDDRPPEPAGFLTAYPGYRSTAVLDRLRTTEYAYLDAVGHVYLDYARAGLSAQTQLAAHAERIRLAGSPLAQHPASAASTESIERARRAVLAHFNASPTDYTVIFTPNATGAGRLVADAFPFGRGARLVLTGDNHSSVNSIRESARSRGALTRYVPCASLDLRVDDADLDRALTRPARGRRGLLAYPAQSDFSGVQHSLRWIQLAHERGYDVLLDAAAYAPSNRLDLSAVTPDFVTVSWYKVFGYPTGVGSLIARREALERLRRPGSAAAPDHQADALADRLSSRADEDGTPAFLQIPAVEAGLSWVNGIGMDLIQRRVMCLTGWLLERLSALRHGGGEPMARIYGPVSTRDRGGTVAFNLLDADGCVFDERAVARDAAAAGISIRAGRHCTSGTLESACKLTAPNWRRALRGNAGTMERYLGLLGMPSGGSLLASVGLASNVSDVQRLVEFIRSTYQDRSVGTGGPGFDVSTY